MAAPVFVSTGTAAQGFVATLTPTLPASLAAGDLMILHLCVGAAKSSSLNTPAGWTKQLAEDNSTVCQAVYWRVFVAGDTAKAVTWTGSTFAVAIVARYTGNDSSSPIGAIGTESTGTTSPHTSTALTTTNNDSLVLLFDACKSGTALTTPGGWSQNYNSASSTSAIVTCDEQTVTPSGTSSGATSSTGGVAAWITRQVEILSPASAASAIVASRLNPLLRR